MPSVTIVVLRTRNGIRTERLPDLCICCSQPVEFEPFVDVPIVLPSTGDVVITLHLQLPSCVSHRYHVGKLKVDYRAGPRFGELNLPEGGLAAYIRSQRKEDVATITIWDVHPIFLMELQRARQMTPEEYEQMMAAANAKFLAKLHSDPVAESDAEKQALKEQQMAEDEATFALAGAEGKGAISQKVSTASSIKFLIATGIVAALSLLLLICISGGVIGYFYLTQPPAPENVVEKKGANKLKEHPARILVVDAEVISFKVPMNKFDKIGKTREYKVTDDSKFFDKAGDPMKLDDLKANDYCVVSPTDDGKALKWLKLTDAPP